MSVGKEYFENTRFDVQDWNQTVTLHTVIVGIVQMTPQTTFCPTSLLIYPVNPCTIYCCFISPSLLYLLCYLHNRSQKRSIPIALATVSTNIKIKKFGEEKSGKYYHSYIVSSHRFPLRSIMLKPTHRK